MNTVYIVRSTIDSFHPNLLIERKYQKNTFAVKDMIIILV